MFVDKMSQKEMALEAIKDQKSFQQYIKRKRGEYLRICNDARRREMKGMIHWFKWKSFSYDWWMDAFPGVPTTGLGNPLIGGRVDAFPGVPTTGLGDPLIVGRVDAFPGVPTKD